MRVPAPQPPQGCQDTSPVNSVIGFAEVQITQEEWFLINARHLLSKYELQDGCPSSSPHAETMENVVEADTCPQMGVNNCLYYLPQCLQHANPRGVGVDLGYK